MTRQSVECAHRFTFRLFFVTACALSSAAFAVYAFIHGSRGMGYAALGAMTVCCAWFWARPDLWTLIPAAVLVLFYSYRAVFLAPAPGVSGAAPTFDLYALYVDASFGTQPSIWVHNLVARSPTLMAVLQVIYEGLPLALGIAYAACLKNRERALRVFAAMFFTAAIGVLCYRLLPICGPAYLPFGDRCFYSGIACSPTSVTPTSPHLIDIDLAWPRNGMPSLHLAWALLNWWVHRKERIANWVAIPFVVLTILATLAYGEHYLVDLAAGFCFALIPWAACFGGESRRSGLIFGTLGYMTWVVLIRYRPELLSHYLSTWAALLASVAVPLFLVYRPGLKRRIESWLDARNSDRV
jgi:hypothetical protein